MNNSDWYSTQSWYAPLEAPAEKTEEEISTPAAESRPAEAQNIPAQNNRKTKDRKRKKRWRIAGIAALVLVLAVSFGTLIYLRNVRDVAVPEVNSEASGSSDSGFPDDYNDFFKSYYTSTSSTSTYSTKIQKIKLEAEYSLELQPADGDPLTLQELYEKCAPSIVGLSGYVDGEEGYYWGSGIIVTADGLILTNAHILEDCDSVTVTLYDDTEYEGYLVGVDSISDIAVLKIEAENLPAAELGQSDALTVGDEVAAIGNPLGTDFRFTLTNGIVSAIDRGMEYNGRTMNLIQTNTAINNGNSGGALFNMYGQVVGITNMKMVSYSSDIDGIGFAIPSATVQSIANTLLTTGEVARTTIGITCGGIPDTVREHYGLPEGLYISDVAEGYDPAEQGIQAGDILTAVNGTPVTTTSEVNAIKDTFAAGDQLTLTIWRNGDIFDVNITLKPAA